MGGGAAADRRTVPPAGSDPLEARLELARRHLHVFGPPDVATAGVPKAGVFAEGAARVVARTLIADLNGGERPGPYDGRGSCYIEFGQGRVGRVDIDFLSGPSQTGTYNEPTAALVAEKGQFGSSRRSRWFGHEPQPLR